MLTPEQLAEWSRYESEWKPGMRPRSELLAILKTLADASSAFYGRGFPTSAELFAWESAMTLARNTIREG